MSLIVTADHSHTHEPIEEGSYSGRCIWVIDLGTQESDYGPKHKVLIGWELPEVQRTFGERIEPAIVHRFYTASLSEKSNLRRDLELWRGRAFTDAELRGLDLSKLIGVPALITITRRSTATGERRHTVAGIARPPKGLEVAAQLLPSRLIDLSDLNYSTFSELPQWVKDQIQKSTEWQQIARPEELAR